MAWKRSSVRSRLAPPIPSSRNVPGSPESRVTAGISRNSLFRYFSVSPRALLACLRRVESPGAVDTAHRVLQNCGQIFRYAVATRRADRDLAADLRGALPPPNGGHFASITEPAKTGALLRSIEGYEGTHVARCAL
jgi:hypothetical protein